MAEEVKQPDRTKTLTEKLCEVGEALTWVQKRGRNTFHGYNYATEADLVLMIRLELYKRKVFLTPNIIECKRENIERKTVKDGKEKITTTAITDMLIKWTWRDGETGELMDSIMPGCGEDSGDKGTYKAITGSEKYLLMKTFLLPTFDDAEQMSGAEKSRLQQRVKTEKIAEAKAKVEARDAQSPEEAERIKASAKVLFIASPDRFQGTHYAIYGTAIAEETVIGFMNDCGAQRFKGPEGILWKLEVQYGNDVVALGKKKGYTIEDKRDE